MFLSRYSHRHSHPARFALFASLALFAVGGLAAALPAAHADTLDLTGTVHTFYISATNLAVRPGEFVTYNHILDAGGDAKAILNRQMLAGTYCVNLVDPVYLPASYNATTTTTDGTVFGETIQNSGKISWLIRHFAGSATSINSQNALQAAIWRTEYGSNWQLDGVDNAKSGNTAALMSTYSDYLNQLGSNTDSVSSVIWISPIKDASQGNSPPNSNTAHYQGLVGVRTSGLFIASAAPEPGSIALLFAGGLPVVGAVAIRRRKRKS